MKPLLSKTIFILSLSLLGLTAFPSNETKDKPNIVFILADDMGYGDLVCYNRSSKIPTPNIDKLAQSGVQFTNAHAAGAWCVPSRYGLLTGCYPGRVKSMNYWENCIIEPQQATLASMLKQHGYKTACVGKWHLGFQGVDRSKPEAIKELKNGPVTRGFDYFFGMHASLDIPPYFYIENDHVVEAPVNRIGDGASANPTSKVSGAFYRAGAISPDFKHEEVLDKFTQKAFAFLDKNKDEPFFLYLPLTAPHTPWLPAKEFVGKSGAGEYGDFTMQVDDLVGQVVAYLEKNNLLENTIVFFSSDNGPVWFPEDIVKFDHESVGALRGMKGDMWEGGSRIPFIVRYPAKFRSGIKSDQLIGFTDVMATLADLLDDTSTDRSPMNSVSFLPELDNSKNGSNSGNEIVIEKRSIIKGDWKLILGSGQGGIAAKYAPDKSYIITEDVKGELYNLRKDLSEENNLYDRYPEKVKELSGVLEKILSKPIQ